MKRVFHAHDDRGDAMLVPGAAEVLERFRLACRALEEDLNALQPDTVAGQILVSVTEGEVVIAYVGKMGPVGAEHIAATTLDAVTRLIVRAGIDPGIRF